MKNFLHGRRSRKKEVTPGTFSIHASAFFLHACLNPQESGTKLQKYQHCTVKIFTHEKKTKKALQTYFILLHIMYIYNFLYLIFQKQFGGLTSFFLGCSCFGYFGYHSKEYLSQTPFSTLLT